MIVIGVEIAPEIVREIEIRVALVAAITIISIRGPIATEIEIVTEIAIMTAIVIVMELKIKLLSVLRPTLIQRCRKGLVHFHRPRRTPSVIRV